MNTTLIVPAVSDFLDVVRADLGDLDPEEQREILDGLEADLGELVAEQGPEALGDPHVYARELRAAAGIEEVVRQQSRPVRASVTAFLDACHTWYDAALTRLPADATPVLAWLRPGWWVLRAWVAVQLADLFFGDAGWNGSELVPTWNGLGLPLLGAMIVLSVLVGVGRLWPGGKRRLGARVVLLGLNVFAIAMVPVVMAQVDSPGGAEFSRGHADGYAEAQSAMIDSRDPGLTFKGKPVRNIYPYDAQGRPLIGVQLVDSSGHPLTLTNNPYNEGTGWGDFLLVPWLNGKTERFNVFPLAEQRQDPSTQNPVGIPALQTPPFASLSSVTLAGVTPSRLVPQAAVPKVPADPHATPSAD